MFKFSFGDITNPRTNKTKDIVVDYKDSFKSILIGLGITAVGVVIGTITTGFMGFKSGVAAFSDAEYKTLEDLGLFDPSSGIINPTEEPETNPEINDKKEEP